MVCGALLLCLPALINGGAIYFPDTGSYVIDGERLVHLSAPLNVRPVFYGLAIWFLHWDRTLWPVLIGQGLVVTHLVWLTMRAVGARLHPVALIGLIAGLAALTPLSWYVSHALPDVFTGATILSLFLLGCCRDRLTIPESVYLFLLAAASISFHLTHLLLAVAIGGATTALWALWRSQRQLIRPLLTIGPTLLALLAFASLSLALYERIALAPNSPPFLMARLIADGPGLAYLREACPARHFKICDYLYTLPKNSNGILWWFMPWVSPEDGRLIRAQQGDIVRGTIEAFPLSVAWNALQNTAEQLVTIDSSVEPVGLAQPGQPVPFYASELAGTLQAHGALAGETLDRVNVVHALVALASVLASPFLAWACLSRRVYRPALLIGVILLGLLVNAFASGALGGVFGRYQGRVIWLLPFGALTAGWVMSRLHAPALLAAMRSK